MHSKYGFPSDIFSFGAILFFLLFRKEKVFYQLVKNKSQFEKMIHDEFNSCDLKFKNQELFETILKHCLHEIPEKRPNANLLLSIFKNSK